MPEAMQAKGLAWLEPARNTGTEIGLQAAPEEQHHWHRRVQGYTELQCPRLCKQGAGLEPACNTGKELGLKAASIKLMVDCTDALTLLP